MEKDYIINKTFRNFLAVSILTSIMQQVRTITDGIVASQFLGPDALSAINLFLPLDSFMYAVMTLFALGASFLSAQDIAKQDFRAASRQFTVAFECTWAKATIRRFANCSAGAICLWR